jgi:hypothetical protein
MWVIGCWDEEDGRLFFDFYFLVRFVAHTVLYNRVMDQFVAAKMGYLQQLRVALTVDNVNDCDEYGRTALHLAACNGQDECVKYCVKMGANVNARTNHGWTPLHIAAMDGRVDFARVFLDADVLVDATDNYGMTPLHFAIDNKRVDVAQMMIDQGAKVSNVKLDEYVPAVPDWITTFIESRSTCRFVAVIVIGIHKYHHTSVTGNNDINVLKLISKHIWSTQMDNAWPETRNERCMTQVNTIYV